MTEHLNELRQVKDVVYKVPISSPYSVNINVKYKEPLDLRIINLIKKKQIMIDTILEMIESDNLKGKSRKRNLVHKRIYLYVILRKHGYILKEIGDMFNRSHATVIHGIDNYKLFEDLKDHLFYADIESYKIALEQYNIPDGFKRDIFKDIKSCNQFRDLEAIKRRIDNGNY